MSRKIVYLTVTSPSLSGWWAMPTSYDTGKVTATDIAEDSEIRSAVQELATLRESTRQSWEMAAETSEGESHDQAEHDMEAALDCWDEAIRLLGDRNGGPSDLREIVTQLEGARALAKEWGEDDRERTALAMFAEAS